MNAVGQAIFSTYFALRSEPSEPAAELAAWQA